MDITPDKVLEIQQYAREPISLDQTIGDEGDSQLGDFIEDSEAVVAVDAVSFTLMQDQLTSVLQTLSEREAGVVRLRFGLTDGQPRTLDEIGQVYGVTRERIRQIESKTMSKLRHPQPLPGAARLPGLSRRTMPRPRRGRAFVAGRSTALPAAGERLRTSGPRPGSGHRAVAHPRVGHGSTSPASWRELGNDHPLAVANWSISWVTPTAPAPSARVGLTFAR